MASLAETKEEGISGQAIILVLLTAAVTGVMTFFAQSFADEASVRDESMVSEVRQFLEAGEEYKELAPAFMRDLTQSRDISDDQALLIKNLSEQNSSLQTAMSNLDGWKHDAARDYQIRLGKASRLLASEIEISNSEPVVQELMDIFNEEVCISHYLRDEADLGVSLNNRRECDYP